MNPVPSLATIPANRPFLLEIARSLLAQSGGKPESLTHTLILLPNRRACRSLREAFLECSEGKSLLLPRIAPIGELDEDGALFGDIARNLAQMDALPPVIASTRRLFLLAQLVMEFEQARLGRNHMEQAVQLAQQLARFIDDTAREGLDFSALAALVPEELAAHWQQTLSFLNIISHRWPQILQAEGAVDPVTHRNTMLAAVVAAWQKEPPQGRIIAAGSTGSQPATANLLTAISRLPGGLVILPALDKAMGKEEWEVLAETHPQYALKQLLKRMKVERSSVQDFVAPEASSRLDLLRAVFAPPAATTHWRSQKLPLEEGCAGIRLLSAETPLDEARMIAISMRELLETPGKNAALVTQDRTLARMVVAQMQRFGVPIDDSAGRSLVDTPPASFLRLVIQMIASQAAPSELLALLRHPLAAAGRQTSQCRFLSRQLETSLLRGIRYAPGLEALLDAERIMETRLPQLEAMLQDMVKATQPLAAIFARGKSVSLSQLLREHIRLAESLAATPEQPGSERLWAGEAGSALAALLADVSSHADVLQQVDPFAYAGMFEALLAQGSYWPSHGLHPRLHILSPMEARLQRYDLVILGGLNEGSWPALPGADPWMSRPMREKFGLPASERAIGQSAHDIYQLLAAPRVLITRARKKDGAPAVPSRWLVRLETLVGGQAPELLSAMRDDARFAGLLSVLDAPAEIPAIARPEPCPPLSARPRRMRVTSVDTWLADPYMIYAKSILGLGALDALDKEPDAADFGNIVHEALEDFVRDNPHYMPPHALEELIECGREAFSHMIDRPAVACLWWPRFEAMAAWLISQEQKRRGSIANIIAEREGILEMEVDGKKFVLTTRIDRLEIARDGRATIIDYKTGMMPSESEMRKGAANQLPLAALVAQHGELHPSAGELHVAALEYWKLAGSADDCEIVHVEAQELMQAARERLENLIREFDKAETAYSAQNNPALLPRYNDYEHLTRRQEWEVF